MKKICIIYDSKHKMNTEKLLLSLKNIYNNLDIIKINNFDVNTINNYEKIGLASGIYWGKFSKNIQNLLDKILESNIKNLFFIYTSGSGKVKYEKKLIKKVEDKNKVCLGIFSCKGFDTYGPFILIGGINKGRPNEKDIENFIEFFKNIN
ncbi:NADPH-dependent FMN reductase family protein [Fusobacterium canifelinum]|uniref:Flavodoxin n=1 Tax=Fusobacterium canifelinum TaxID=285729 RepID=A0A7T9LDZ7_9FUSO|nr:flavodoxin [Fusobacterium canifelinum]QQB73169.1 flavodoxin [Fusobacterium canifelinum]QQS86682.1 flavodoxin [Fusobacterium canifelinum]